MNCEDPLMYKSVIQFTSQTGWLKARYIPPTCFQFDKFLETMESNAAPLKISSKFIHGCNHLHGPILSSFKLKLSGIPMPTHTQIGWSDGITHQPTKLAGDHPIPIPIQIKTSLCPIQQWHLAARDGKHLSIDR